MAANSYRNQPTQQELMAIAREIPADKIDVLATDYLFIDPQAELTHIKYGEADDSIRTNFKCLLRWCQKTTVPDQRQVLFDKLSKAAEEGLVTQKGVEILSPNNQSVETSEGKWFQKFTKAMEGHFHMDFHLKFQEKIYKYCLSTVSTFAYMQTSYLLIIILHEL